MWMSKFAEGYERSPSLEGGQFGLWALATRINGRMVYQNLYICLL